MAGQSWALLPSLCLGGQEQMQLDRWMLQQVSAGASSNTPQALLRFYRWSSPTLSLGHHQAPPTGTTPHGLPWVQRPSGGATVLHGGDLCYAIALATPPRGRRQAYGDLNRWLQNSFQQLGQQLQGGSEPQRRHLPHCFASATAADLVDDGGNKRIGSAQLWRQGRLLQHGSIQLNPDQQLWQQLFGDTAPAHLDGHSAEQLESLLTAAAQRWLFACAPLQWAWPEPWPWAALTSGNAATVSAIGAKDKPRG